MVERGCATVHLGYGHAVCEKRFDNLPCGCDDMCRDRRGGEGGYYGSASDCGRRSSAKERGGDAESGSGEDDPAKGSHRRFARQGDFRLDRFARDDHEHGKGGEETRESRRRGSNGEYYRGTGGGVGEKGSGCQL